MPKSSPQSVPPEVAALKAYAQWCGREVLDLRRERGEIEYGKSEKVGVSCCDGYTRALLVWLCQSVGDAKYRVCISEVFEGDADVAQECDLNVINHLTQDTDEAILVSHILVLAREHTIALYRSAPPKQIPYKLFGHFMVSYVLASVLRDDVPEQIKEAVEEMQALADSDGRDRRRASSAVSQLSRLQELNSEQLAELERQLQRLKASGGSPAPSSAKLASASRRGAAPKASESEFSEPEDEDMNEPLEDELPVAPPAAKAAPRRSVTTRGSAVTRSTAARSGQRS